jgi:hypothetical protein
MEYSVDYLEGKMIIQVVIKGRVNFKLAEQYSVEAIKLAREYNCKKYLFNHSKTISSEGVYRLHTDGDALEKFGFKPGDKIAIVISRGKDDSHFSEETDSNAKWSNFKYFYSAKDAVGWLGEDE